MAQIPGFVQGKSEPNIGTSNTAVTTEVFYKPNLSAAGNCSIIFVQVGAGNPSVTIADEGNNSYTLISSVYGTTNVNTLFLFASSIVTPARQITISGLGSNGFVAVGSVDFYNITPASCVSPDAIWTNPVTGNGDASSSTTPLAGASNESTSASGDMILMVADKTSLWPPGTTSYSAGTGQPNITWNLVPGASQLTTGITAQYGIYNATAAFNPTLTWAPAAEYIAIAVAFRPGTSGSGPNPGIQPVAVTNWDVSGWTGNNNASLTEQLDVGAGSAIGIMSTSYPTYDITSITASGITFYAGPALALGSPSNASGDISGWYACGVPPGSYTVTINFTTVAKSGDEPDSDIIAWDYTGAQTGSSTACYDNGWSGNGDLTSGTTISAVSGMVPSEPNEHFLAAAGVDESYIAAPVAPWLNDAANANSFSGCPEEIIPDECNGQAHYNYPSTSPLSLSWTTNAAPLYWVTVVMAFKPAAVMPLVAVACWGIAIGFILGPALLINHIIKVGQELIKRV